MFITVAKAEIRKIYAPYYGIRRLHLESDQDSQERWDERCGQWFRYHVDLLACTWLMDGNDIDLKQAKAWADANGWEALVVPDACVDNALKWSSAIVRQQIIWE